MAHAHSNVWGTKPEVSEHEPGGDIVIKVGDSYTMMTRQEATDLCRDLGIALYGSTEQAA